MRYQRMVLFQIIAAAICLGAAAQPGSGDVKVVGEMRNVMWKGQLSGIISIDTIAVKDHLYGLGPVEYLTGELLIADGRCYRSAVVSDTVMKVEETAAAKAPFFAYANISRWKESVLPDSIITPELLEQHLDLQTRSTKRPFMFRLTGVVETAAIHIVNLPAGKKVSSPDDAHTGRVSYRLFNEPSDIIGFFSREHQGIFTHHDSWMHMHLITADRQKMGHLDDVLFKKGTMKLFLPEE